MGIVTLQVKKRRDGLVVKRSLPTFVIDMNKIRTKPRCALLPCTLANACRARSFRYFDCDDAAERFHRRLSRPGKNFRFSADKPPCLNCWTVSAMRGLWNPCRRHGRIPISCSSGNKSFVFHHLGTQLRRGAVTTLECLVYSLY